jgi:aminopeptidase
LFDENAASHIAFGAAILNAVPGARTLPAEQRMVRGINDSSVHSDFMIGSDALDVDGITRDGEVKPILRAGAFVLD